MDFDPAAYSILHRVIDHVSTVLPTFDTIRPIPDGGYDTADYVAVAHLVSDTSSADVCDDIARRAIVQIDIWERGDCETAGALAAIDAVVSRHLAAMRGGSPLSVTSAWRQWSRPLPTANVKDNALAISVAIDYTMRL